MSERIKTEHSARLRLVHGEDCEGCQDVGVRMALAIVHLAGWRIVRTEAEEACVDGCPEWLTRIVEEWTP